MGEPICNKGVARICGMCMDPVFAWSPAGNGSEEAISAPWLWCCKLSCGLESPGRLLIRDCVLLWRAMLFAGKTDCWENQAVGPSSCPSSILLLHHSIALVCYCYNILLFQNRCCSRKCFWLFGSGKRPIGHPGVFFCWQSCPYYHCQQSSAMGVCTTALL